MFADSATVIITAGKGGDGAVSFRHEIYVDKGGPDGGDGGRGGNVIFRADRSLNTLNKFRYQPQLKAEPGRAGGKRRMHGRSGEDLVVPVPIGTIVYRDTTAIADFTTDEQELVVAEGGRGGFGNAHFKSSTRQTPRVAELGEPGESFESRLELKLLADVGLVGFPNAGKSTFLSVVSNAKPEIADYAFTTLTPNLGVADIDDASLLIADIPGLIEGAAEGKGLGDAFLKHVERTSVLLHLIDVYQDDIAAAYQTIRSELEKYSSHLVEVPEVVALTKTEGLDQDMINHRLGELQAAVKPETPLFAISSQAHHGLTEVLRELKAQVEQAKDADPIDDEDEGQVVIRLSAKQQADEWKIEQVNQTYVITGSSIEKFALRTNFDNIHSLNRLRDIMRKKGITHELIRRGADAETTLQIGQRSFTLEEA